MTCKKSQEKGTDLVGNDRKRGEERKGRREMRIQAEK